MWSADFPNTMLACCNKNMCTPEPTFFIDSVLSNTDSNTDSNLDKTKSRRDSKQVYGHN